MRTHGTVQEVPHQRQVSMRFNPRIAPFTLAGLLFIASCDFSDGAGSPTDSNDRHEPTVTARSIDISLPSANLEPGHTMQANARVLGSNGLPIEDPSLRWSVSDSSIVRISANGEIEAIGGGVVKIYAEVQEVADTIGLSVGRLFDIQEGTLIAHYLDDFGNADLYINGDFPFHFSVRPRSGTRIDWDGAELTYTEHQDRFFLSVNPTTSHATPFLFSGSRQVLDALLESLTDTDTTARVWAPGPPKRTDQTAPLVITGAVITIAVVSGVAVIGVAVTSYTAYSSLAEMAERNAANHILLEEWEDLFNWCAPREELLAFLNNDLEARNRSGDAYFSLGLGVLTAGIGNVVVEASVIGGEMLGLLVEDQGITEEDLLAWASIMYDVPADDFTTPSGRVLVAHSVQEYYRGRELSFTGIDPWNDACAGRVPRRISWWDPPSSTSIGETVVLEARALSEWGNGVEGVPVEFEVTQGGGILSESAAMTDERGFARVYWTAPETEGEAEITLRAQYQGVYLDGSPKTLRLDVRQQDVFFLAPNGVTVLCPNADIGASGEVNGTTYTRRDRAQITTANASTTCTSGITQMSSMFSGEDSFNEDISHWDVSDVESMAFMFQDASSFNIDISHWKTSNVRNMNWMFWNARSFDQNIGRWDVSQVTHFIAMFQGALTFNGDISEWDVSGAISMSSMFNHAHNFNQDIGNWDISGIRSLNMTFAAARSFDQDISRWDVSNVTDMNQTFRQAESFHQDLDGWDVSRVTNMHRIFAGASAFNGRIGTWDVRNVEDFFGAFLNADSFNQDISGWHVGGARVMHSMFNEASSFNQDIGSWDVGGVTDMTNMFRRAVQFNQDLSSWCVTEIPSPPANFDAGASSWSLSRPQWGSCPQGTSHSP